MDDTAFTLLRSLLGDFDFEEMQAGHSVMGPLFFVCFVVLCVFIVLNMFIAILSEYYDLIKNETRQWREDASIFERQGMSVPTKNFAAMLTANWNYLFMNMPLLLEVDSSNLPAKFILVQEC